MVFIAREHELARFEAFLAKTGQQVALVYGRRRIGKSELIKQALRKSTSHDVLYFECKQTTEMNNVESIAMLISERFGIPRPSFTGIEEELDYLFVRSREQGITLVLDEYPYLRSAVPGLDSILQSLIDRHAESSQLKLIVCGSYIDVMRSLLEEENPLFGRVDLTIKLGPLDYHEAAGFYPGFSHEDQIRLYSVFGGVPYYCRLVNENESVRENIIRLVTAPDARFQGEIDMFLRAEISKTANANEVFEALAMGHTKYKDIRDQSHVSSGPTLVDVLKKLVDMEIVEKRPPINDPSNKRRTRYAISDQLTRFFYRYVSRYRSQIGIMGEDAFFDRYVADDFESNYVPHEFETVCRQYLIRENRAGRMAPPFEAIGSFAYDNPTTRTSGEFDVVGKAEDGYAFYECKFWGRPVDKRTVLEELAQVEASGLDCFRYGFFSRSGFEGVSPREELVLYDLEDLFA